MTAGIVTCGEELSRACGGRRGRQSNWRKNSANRGGPHDGVDETTDETNAGTTAGTTDGTSDHPRIAAGKGGSLAPRPPAEMTGGGGGGIPTPSTTIATTTIATTTMMMIPTVIKTTGTTTIGGVAGPEAKGVAKVSRGVGRENAKRPPGARSAGERSGGIGALPPSMTRATTMTTPMTTPMATMTLTVTGWRGDFSMCPRGMGCP